MTSSQHDDAESTWVNSGGLVAAVFGLLAAGAVAFMTWYAVAYASVLGERLGQMQESRSGLLILTVVVLAGGLLSFAFGRLEEAAVLYRKVRKHRAEAGDSS